VRWHGGLTIVALTADTAPAAIRKVRDAASVGQWLREDR